MEKCEVEMEDVGELPRDSANGRQCSENIDTGLKVAREQEELLPGSVVIEEQNTGEAVVERYSNIGNEAEEQNPDENDSEDLNLGDNVVKEQRPTKNSSEEKRPSDYRQPSFELCVNDASNKGSSTRMDEPTEGETVAVVASAPDNDASMNEPTECETVAVVASAPDSDASMDATTKSENVSVIAEPSATTGSHARTDESADSKNIAVIAIGTSASDADAKMYKRKKNKNEDDYTSPTSLHEPTTPNSLVKCSTKSEDQGGETSRNWLSGTKMTEDDETGEPKDQAEFMKELESFYRERVMEFKPPKFYGQPLNCLKLWRAVIRLGGYDQVTGSKLWRQVGESFHPPKTCTTVSWTFRIFYEKALLEYERHKRQIGELKLPDAALPEPSSVENAASDHQAPESGRARRDAAARAMQGWHVQRLFGYGEDKNFNQMSKREKNLKSIGSLKQKRPSEVEHAVKAARTETSKQPVTTVVDVGPPADWVKINVKETEDCFEVYALVPGLLREEVRVQSDPAGRVVITGQPDQPDNPWGITAFKKVVSLPARIDPLQTSAVVSLHGRLLVRVPFEQTSN